MVSIPPFSGLFVKYSGAVEPFGFRFLVSLQFPFDYSPHYAVLQSEGEPFYFPGDSPTKGYPGGIEAADIPGIPLLHAPLERAGN